jgi:hypothetical protein
VNIEIESSETGMDLRDLLSDSAFRRRNKSSRCANRESLALGRLAKVFAEEPETVLQELVQLAVEYCGADSSGISLEETGESGEKRFRWIVVAGSFAPYLNGTTPREYSPCGTCLDSRRPQLYRVTAPYYDFLGVVAEPITDGLLIPWESGDLSGTLWAVSHNSPEAFDLEDYTLLSSLAGFTSIAIHHQSQQQFLRQQENEAASAARAHELAHQINNPLQSLTNTVYLARQGGEHAVDYMEQAAKELSHLSQLVRKLLDVPHGVE